jgi:hypothetical protein
MSNKQKPCILPPMRPQKKRTVLRMLGRPIDTLRSLIYRLVPLFEMLRESGVDTGVLKRG